MQQCSSVREPLTGGDRRERDELFYVYDLHINKTKSNTLDVKERYENQMFGHIFGAVIGSVMGSCRNH